MGAAIETERCKRVDYDRFTERLIHSLAALARLLERPGFGAGPATLGMELELFLVDRRGRPLPHNHAMARAARDPLADQELDRGRSATTVPGRRRALSETVTPAELAHGGLYPPPSELRAASRHIAIQVVRTARDREIGRAFNDRDVEPAVDAAMWFPAYAAYVPR